MLLFMSFWFIALNTVGRKKAALKKAAFSEFGAQKKQLIQKNIKTHQRALRYIFL